jgi:ABC-type transporter Mla maintaining outer membrane lipid asymmetry ATPase subunit MlaF
MDRMTAAAARVPQSAPAEAKSRLIGAGKTFEVGPSVCGKSSILNLVAGLLAPSAGCVLYDGQEVTGPNRRVGYLTQKDTLLPWRATADNIRIALELKCRATPRAEASERVAEMMDLVGLRGFEHHYPAELSGGMRKRASLARALALDPELLFLDEPTAGLDPIGAAAFDALIRDLQKSLGLTVFLVTHDLDTLMTICDRIAVLVDKRIKIGTMAELLHDTHPWINAYFHGPRGRVALAAHETARGA